MIKLELECFMMNDEAIKYNKYEVQLLLDIAKNEEFKMERIFDIYKQPGTKHFYYNLFNSVRFPDNINKSMHTTYYTRPNETWALISYRHYNRIDLWWLIASLNKIDDTFTPIQGGTKLMIPTPSAVRFIIDTIKNKT